MATSQGQIVKIYKLQTTGYSELSKQLDSIAAKFDKIKKAKLSAAEKVLSAQSADDLKKYSAELSALTVKEQELKVQRQQMLNDQKAQNIARQEAIRKMKEEAGGAQVVAGSYNDILRQQRQLYALVKNTKTGSPVTFQGQTLQFDQAIAKLKQLSAAEQDFRRQFARDGLLVAEYASGIRQGLGGIGDIGNKVTTSLANGFKQLKGQMAQFVLGFIGAQAVLSGIQKSFTDTVRLDSLDSALRSVSKTEEEFRVNTDFLLKTTKRLGLEMLDTTAAFKSFYAAGTQAGLSADQTREIFEAAAEASATLKLSQQDTNGIMLAFNQIASKGKVQAEELRGQIGERVPGAFSIAARAIGVTQQELNKMLENGEVLSNDFLPKFAAELKKTFGTDSTKNIEGLQANINRLKNRFTELLQSNQAGLTSFFSFLINGAGILIRLIPLLTVALALYTAEQIRAYIATQLTTKGTILYNIALVAQRTYVLAANIALTAYYGAIALLTGGLTKATVATTFFSNALRAIPLGAILTILGLIAGAIVAFGRSVTNTAKGLSDLALKQMALNSVNQEARRIYVDQISQITSWVSVIKSATSSADTKKRAVEELTKINKAFGESIKDNVVDIKLLDEVTKKVTVSMMRQARIEAAANLVKKKQQAFTAVAIARQEIEIQTSGGRGFFVNSKETDLADDVIDVLKEIRSTNVNPNLFGGKSITIEPANVQKALKELKEKEEELKKELEKFFEIQTDLEKDLQGFADENAAGVTQFEVDIKKLKDQIEALDKEINSFQGSKADLAKKVTERKRLQDQLDKLLGNNKSVTSRSSRLTSEQKDAFKDIDAVRDQLLAEQTAAFEQQVFNEETYLKEVFDINVEAINKKLRLLKGTSAEERKQIAELNLQKIQLERDTNKKIFEVQEKQLQDRLDVELKQIEQSKNAVIDNIESTELQKAEAQLNADQLALAARQRFYNSLLALNDKYNREATIRAKNDIDALMREIRNGQKQVTEAALQDIKARGDREIQIERINFEKRRAAILNNQKISASKRKKQLDELARAEERTISAIELKVLNAQLEIIKMLYSFGLISEQQFLDAQEKMLKKANEITDKMVKDGEQKKEKIKRQFSDIKGAIQAGLRNLFKINDNSDEDQALGNIIAQSYQLALDAMSSFYDAERQRIQENLDLQIQRIDMEKEQAQSRAQSQAEIEIIEKQAEAKKKQAQKAAGEQIKKTRRSEAKIALAVELANIAVQASAYPFPASLVIGGILSGLALGRYALRVNEINREQFAFGGQPGEVPTRGGEFGGRPHSKGGTDFSFKGKKYNAEAKELAVIRTRNANPRKIYQVTGNQMQIASAANRIGGGIDFKPGAFLKKYDTGGMLGASLQAPQWSPAGVTNIFNNDKVSDLVEVMEKVRDDMKQQTKAFSDRIDRIEVVQVTRTVTNAQKKEVWQSGIGTL